MKLEADPMKASTMKDFLSMLLEREGINKDEYDELTRSCTVGGNLSVFWDSMESIVNNKLESVDSLSSEYKEIVLNLLIDLNLELENFGMVENLAKELYESEE